ncbi:hypothetical protein HIM_03086 [Hirsutella minnesotensis 3608]|nr:hypothetical protein HIM_03086 [Hirsutella minnesotensis 3608]
MAAPVQLRASALRSLRPAAALRARVLPSAAIRCYATDLEPEKPKPTAHRGGDAQLSKSFQAQVTGSIVTRLRREREQRQQYERWRDMTDPSRNWTITFVFLTSVGIAYWLGTYWPRGPDPSSTLPLSKTQAPPHNTKLENMQAAWADFVKIVGQDNVSTLETDIAHHSTSSWSTHRPQPSEKPFCVVFPATTEEVSEVMKVCHARRIPVVGYSGGTSLEGHYAQTRKGISINFGRMNKVLALHKEDLDVIVQPAVGWEALNDDLAKEGLFFPPDPGPGAMIGGMVGTGCSGTNAYRYGTMREWVLSLTVVLADGTVIKTRQRPRKSSAGYDLTKLFVGSEGTLGLVTEATLKVTVQPAATNVAVCTFRSIHDAAACVGKVVGSGVPIAAVEILDDNQMKYINAAGMTSRSWVEAPTLFFKFSGTPAGIKEQIAQVKGLARDAGSRTFEFARNQDEQDELWSARKEALWSVMAAGREGDSVWTGDVAVPMSRLPALVEETKEDIKKSGLVGSIVGHVGDGNFHTILVFGEPQRKKAEMVVHRMVKRAIEMEGTVTGEHGVGLVKRDYLPHELGETTVDAMRQIKKALDPLCILNCDKVATSPGHHLPPGSLAGDFRPAISGAMSLFTAQLHPGRALGFLVLGASLHDVLTRLKAEPQRFPKLEVLYSPERPVTEPVCIVLPHNGVRLRFDGPEQRLRLIEVTDFTKNHITFKDRDLLKPAANGTSAPGSPVPGDSSSGPTFRHIYHRVLGPTYAGEFIPPPGGQGDGIYVLSYPGVAFNFALAASSYSPDKDVVSLLSASSSQVATSMAVFNGDSWAEARPTLWTEVLPSVKLPLSSARGKDVYPDEVSLVRLHGGGKIDLFRKWTSSAFRIQLGETTPQDLVKELGPPSAIYRKNDQKMVIHKMRTASTARSRPSAAELGRPDESTDTDQSSMNTGSDDSDADDAIDEQSAGNSSGECFYNYFYLGFDILLSTPTAPSAAPPGAQDDGPGNPIQAHHPDRLVATKLVLHGNIPGCYEFNRHRRCRWEIGYLDDGDTVTSETEFRHIEERMQARWEGALPPSRGQPRQRGMVLNRGWGDSPGSSCEFLGGWEESGARRAEANGDSTTTLYGFPGLVFEVLKNDYVNTVTVF